MFRGMSFCDWKTKKSQLYLQGNKFMSRLGNSAEARPLFFLFFSNVLPKPPESDRGEEWAGVITDGGHRTPSHPPHTHPLPIFSILGLVCSRRWSHSESSGAGIGF